MIVDYNGVQQTGTTSHVMPTEPIADKWAAFNWHVIEIHGHNVAEILDGAGSCGRNSWAAGGDYCPHHQGQGRELYGEPACVAWRHSGRQAVRGCDGGAGRKDERMESLIRNPFGSPAPMRKAYGEALVELGAEREDVVVLSADVQSSDFSYMFEAAYPKRFFNVGIAEPALVDVAVGLANGGKIPIANTFAFLFATRALEMVRTHLCYGGANVKLAGAYAGLSDSFDGPTHQTISDLAILRSLPGMTIVVPADSLAVKKLLPQVAAWNGPVYFRLCRNEVPEIFTDAYEPEIGKGITLIDGDDATVIACGVMVARAIQAARQLAQEGIHDARR